MNEPISKEEKRSWWWIHVTSYGGFAYFDTESEANIIRKAKAAWEGGRGTMRAATETEIAHEQQAVHRRRELGCALDERELESIR
jgi:hypothetical protein